MTVNEELQAASANPHESSPITTEVQRDTNTTSNKGGDIEPHPHARQQTLHKEEWLFSFVNVDGVDSMDTTENHAVNNTSAARAE